MSTDLDGLYPDLDRVIWRRHGSCDVCVACGTVRDGTTASAADAHRMECIAVRVYTKMRFAMVTAIEAEREACAQAIEDESHQHPGSEFHYSVASGVVRARK